MSPMHCVCLLAGMAKAIPGISIEEVISHRPGCTFGAARASPDNIIAQQQSATAKVNLCIVILPGGDLRVPAARPAGLKKHNGLNPSTIDGIINAPRGRPVLQPWSGS